MPTDLLANEPNVCVRAVDALYSMSVLYSTFTIVLARAFCTNLFSVAYSVQKDKH